MVRYRARLPPPPSPPPGSTVEITAVPAGGARVTFARQNVPPPGELYVDTNDTLLILAQATTGTPALDLRGRLLRPSGEIVPFAYTVNAGSGQVSNAFPLGDGFLLTCSISALHAFAQPFRAYIVAAIARGTISSPEIYTVLFSGAVTQNRALGWPGGPQEASEDGPGNTRIIGLANPAAGADWTLTIPFGTLYELISLRAFFFASAVAGTRSPFLNLDTGAGGTSVFHIPPQAALQANQNTSISWAAGFPFVGFGTGTMICPFPIGTRAREGWRLFTNTTGIDAADQWSQIGFLVREWPSWHS